MKRWHRAGLTLLLLVLPAALAAQDLHSSQEYALAPLWHPAATGRFDGLYRVGAGYRDQWRSIPASFQTLFVSADVALRNKNRRSQHHFGLGLIASGDQAGDGRLSTTEAGLQVAYHQPLARNGKVLLSAGFGASGGNKSVDVARLVFNNQWTETGFDPSLPNGESPDNWSTAYLDLQAGAGLFARTSLHNYLFADASLHHINRARISFFDGGQALGLRPLLTVGGRFGLRGTTAVLPRLQFSTERNARQLLGGTNIAWGLDYKPDGDQIIAGLWYRYGDAVILNAGARLGDLQFIISYDLNASRLTPASGGYGAAELTLVYTGRGKDRRLECPNNF